MWDLTAQDVDDSAIDLGRVNKEIEVDPKKGIASAISNRWLFTGSPEGDVLIWDLDRPHSTDAGQRLQAHDRPAFALELSPNERWLASASEDGLRLWDLSNDSPPDSRRTLLESCAYAAFNVAFDGGSRWLVVSNGDVVHIWDLASDDLEAAHREVVVPELSGEAIFKMAMSYDLRSLFTSRYNATAQQLWRLRHEPLVPRSLVGHYGVQDASISPDGHWLATANRQGSAQLWDLTVDDPSSTMRLLRGAQWPHMETPIQSQW